MASAYDENGNFIGTLVDNLTDGPTIECNPKRQAFGKMGQYYRSQAICDFQRSAADSRLVYGLRTVYHRAYGIVEQALVNGIGDDLVWINCRITPATMALPS